MENGDNKFESVYSNKVRAGKRRTYFFDVRKTKKEDFYITITESTRKFDGSGYDRHKVFLYKEDFNRFEAALSEVINHVKSELMPDFDYDYYAKRQEEWEAQQALEAANEASSVKETVEEAVEEIVEETVEETVEEAVEEASTETAAADSSAESSESESSSESSEDVSSEEDMSW